MIKFAFRDFREDTYNNGELYLCLWIGRFNIGKVQTIPKLIDPKPASTHTSLPPSPVHSEDLGSAEVKGGPVPLCPHHLQSQSRQGRGSSLQLLEMQNLTMMSTVSIPRGPASSRNPSNWLTDGAQNQTFENS